MKITQTGQSDGAYARYEKERIAHWDNLACKVDSWRGWGSYYHKRLKQVYGFLVPSGKKIIEIGCAQGDLLAALKPAVGVGVDFSGEMIKRAKQRHPKMRFIQADAHKLDIKETFDVIVLSDIVNDLWDVELLLEQVRHLSTPRTRLIINLYSRVWELPLIIAQRLGLARGNLAQNWLAPDDIVNLLDLTGFEVIRHWQEMLLPLPIPILSALFNRYIAKIWPFRLMALTNFIMARPLSERSPSEKEPTVSIVVPARNEAGNIPEIFTRTPELGRWTELLFVEGHSRDDTYKAIETAISKHPERKCKLLRQKGKGKGDAVRLGFEEAGGDILMILDADLSTAPEDMRRFYEALRLGKGEFINGVRLVYPREKGAMRFLNFLGNKFFTLAFSWLMGQHVKDTLCGTKVLSKADYDQIAANRSYFGDFDPFGDFDLLFGAAKSGLKIVDMPIRYRERTYGTTNIQRWRHGWLLLKMVVFGARRIKFI
ncbi:MAG: methyltransferase domain-containing protein [Candidatus Omnitrophica bacterium]|nr:methyltransferase domain-containing protein [Candidatus Omnitrophota bacterium]